MRMLILTALLTAGCHAKFKKNAPNLETVRVEVLNNTGPSVQLGGTNFGAAALDPGTAIVGTAADIAIGAVQTANAVDIARKLNDSLDIEALNHAMAEGLAEVVGDGPPFAATTAEAPHVLQITVENYGMFAPYLGAPGTFTWNVRARLYRQDGERVYRTNLQCDIGAGAPQSVSVAFGTVNNARLIKDMSRDEIQAAFEDMAWYCGRQFATRMRKHAG